MGITAVLDTNIFLNVKNREKPYYTSSRQVLDAADDGQIHAIVSAVSIAEMCSGYHSARDEQGKEEFITHLVSSQTFTIVNLDLKVADAAGMIRAETGLRLPDAIIVASGLAKQAIYIVTHDEEFKKAKRYIKVVTSKELAQMLTR
ncbi:MAG: PIN domain-containing protein [Thaumarchaeota archaeon]|nr:PIN domain-containing protein [Nitrososphaerota archaeon]MCL5317676.1 PIN domain-containing protein [Nitrososphaerota archaeon]